MTKYVVTSEHAEDVGGGHMVDSGQEFDDKDLEGDFKDHLKGMQDAGSITPAATTKSGGK